MSWALALHGGAGDIPRTDDPEPYRAALVACRERGTAVLTGKSAPSFSPYKHLNVATQAVIETVIALEDCELFNAGRGSVFNCEGKIEMEAQVMDNQGHCGACAGLTQIRNPILAAERVMSETKHALLISQSAEKFAIQHGLRTEPTEYFHTEKRWKQFEAARDEGVVALDHNVHMAAEPDDTMGTVGAVAMDTAGNIACATSTGGMTNKMAGRAGDTPLVGAGGYAGAKGGVCATGKGDQFIYHNTCGRICAAMDYAGLSLADACEKEIGRMAIGDGGVVGVDDTGAAVFNFNSQGMLRAMEESSGRKAVGVWKEWIECNF